MSKYREIHIPKSSFEKLSFSLMYKSNDRAKTIKMLALLFSGIDEGDILFIEGLFNRVINLFIDKKEIQIYFNEKFKNWLVQIDELLYFLKQKHHLLIGKKSLYLEELNKSDNEPLYLENKQNYLDNIELDLHRILTQESVILSENNDILINLLKTINSSIIFFDKIFWIANLRQNQYNSIKNYMSDINKEFQNYSDFFIETSKKFNQKYCFLTYEILSNVEFHLEISKMQLQNYRDCLCYIQNRFEVSFTLKASDFGLKLMESYILDCLMVDYSEDNFMKIMLSYIDAVEDAEKSKKENLKLIFDAEKQKFYNLISLMLDNLHKYKNYILSDNIY